MIIKVSSILQTYSITTVLTLFLSFSMLNIHLPVENSEINFKPGEFIIISALCRWWKWRWSLCPTAPNPQANRLTLINISSISMKRFEFTTGILCSFCPVMCCNWKRFHAELLIGVRCPLIQAGYLSGFTESLSILFVNKFNELNSYCINQEWIHYYLIWDWHRNSYAESCITDVAVDIMFSSTQALHGAFHQIHNQAVAQN